MNWTDRLVPAGGLNSNLKDMLLWVGFHANQGQIHEKQMISKKNMDRLTQAMIFDGDFYGHESYYALGWGRMEYSPYPIISHDGATLGTYNFAAFIPEEKLGIVILSNLRLPQFAFALGLHFFDSYFHKPQQDWIQKLVPQIQEEPNTKLSNPYPSLPLSSYEGGYENSVYGKISVTKKGTDLELTMGKNHLKFILKHWNKDIFTFEWPIVDESPSKVIFIPDEMGKISKVRMEYFAKEGSGDFEKSQ